MVYERPNALLRMLLIAGILSGGLLLGLGLARDTYASGTVTDAGGRESAENHDTMFWTGVEPFIVFGKVTAQTQLDNTKGYYWTSLYTSQPILPVVVVLDLELLNLGGVTWGTSYSLAIDGVGSLRGYMAPWGYAPAGSVPPYTIDCNSVNLLHECWRGVPDWLIVASATIRINYSHSSMSPWAPVYGTNSDSMARTWW